MKIDAFNPSNAYLTKEVSGEGVVSYNMMTVPDSAVEGFEEASSLQLSEDGRKLSEWARDMTYYFRSGYDGSILDQSYFRDAVKRGEAVSSNSRLYTGDLFEYAAETYDRMKADIEKGLANDPDKKKLYTMALDEAFNRYLQSEMFDYAVRLDAQKDYEEERSKWTNLAPGQTRPPKNPIAAHKDFDAGMLHVNLTELVRDFARAYIKGGWEHVNSTLGTEQTTSVNDPSLRDFMTIIEALSTGGDTMEDDMGAYWRGKYDALAKDAGLSDFMRDVFRVSGT